MVVTARTNVFVIPTLAVFFRFFLFKITFGIFHDHPELSTTSGGVTHFTTDLLLVGFFRINLVLVSLPFLLLLPAGLNPPLLPVAGGVAPKALRIGCVIFFRVQLGFLLGVGAFARL